MKNNKTGKTFATYPSIQIDLLNRLSKEAEERTMQPRNVDWEDIHKKAALARNEA